MELRKEPLSVSEVLAGEGCEIFVDGDLIVPDVKPDILKILQVDASAYLSSKEAAEGRVNLKGRVDLTILYISDHEDDPVQNIRTSLDFSHKLEKNTIPQGACVNAEADVIRAEFHVINSRKLSLKAIVGIQCEVFGTQELEFVTGIEGADAEIQTEPLLLTAAVADRCESFYMKENVELPSGKPSISEILKVDYKICDKEIKPITEKVVAKGTLNACILYMSNAQTIESTEIDLPFTEVFDLPGVSEGMTCTLDYHISDCSYEAAADSDGDLRIIRMELILCADMHASRQTELQVIRDCYCPGMETKLSYIKRELEEGIASPSCQNTLRDIAAVDSSLPQIAAVYNVVAKAVVTDSRIEKEKLAIEGKIEATILYLTDQPQNPVYSYQKEIPFRYLLDCPNTTPEMTCAVRAEVEHVSFHLNVANEVELRCILNLSANVLRKRTLTLIDTVDTLPVSNEDQKGIVIYFVQPGDSIWSIAKRYHVPTNEIEENNHLNHSEKLNPGTRLVIPACIRV